MGQNASFAENLGAIIASPSRNDAPKRNETHALFLAISHWICGVYCDTDFMNENSKHLWDCVAVNLKTNEVHIMARNKTIENAEAITSMAVCRRGVDEEFFAEVVAGKYNDGDKYNE